LRVAFDNTVGTHERDVVKLPVGNAEFVIASEPWPRRHRSIILQKGAILTIVDGDVAGEGVGFGVPVALIKGSFVYSTHAEVEKTEGGAIKTFEMDAISTKRWTSRLLSGLPGPTALFDSWLMGNLSSLYRSRGFAQVVANGFWRLERSTGAIEHGFSSIPTRGRVLVDYKVEADTIIITVNTSGLGPSCEKLFLMNELDAQVFDSYDDSDGLELRGWHVGAWSPVEAEWARFKARDGSSSFKLGSVEGARLFRGREVVPGHLSWAGLAYELEQPLRQFTYTVKIGPG
jgi:hypothetical protein